MAWIIALVATSILACIALYGCANAPMDPHDCDCTDCKPPAVLPSEGDVEAARVQRVEWLRIEYVMRHYPSLVTPHDREILEHRRAEALK